METFLGEIIILAIVIIGGLIGMKIFSVKKPGKSKKVNIFSERPMKTEIYNSYAENDTLTVSPWNLNVLNKNGDIIRSVAIPLSPDSYEEVVIGRGQPNKDEQPNTILIPDMTVSNPHAVIRNIRGDYILSDENSKNGIITFVNDEEQKHSELKLTDGLLVYLGNVPIAFTKSNSRKKISFINRNERNCKDFTKEI